MLAFYFACGSWPSPGWDDQDRVGYCRDEITTRSANYGRVLFPSSHHPFPFNASLRFFLTDFYRFILKMVNFGPYHAWVTVDDEELPEFNTEVDEVAKRVTCWIPSEAGKVCDALNTCLRAQSFLTGVCGSFSECRPTILGWLPNKEF